MWVADDDVDDIRIFITKIIPMSIKFPQQRCSKLPPLGGGTVAGGRDEGCVTSGGRIRVRARRTRRRSLLSALGQVDLSLAPFFFTLEEIVNADVNE